MKHAVIIAHPNPRSLTHAVGEAYRQGVSALGHQAIVRDLYGVGFDPCLRAAEIPQPSGFEFGADVIAERKQLADVDVFAFVYPLWFNAPPAILKGYLDRVFSMGFGFGIGAGGGTETLLDGKRLISFTTSGAPDQWIRDTGVLQALTAMFDRHVGAMCGLQVVDHIHVGGIVSGITEEAVADILQGVRRAVTEHFGDLAGCDLASLRSAT